MIILNFVLISISIIYDEFIFKILAYLYHPNKLLDAYFRRQDTRNGTTCL